MSWGRRGKKDIGSGEKVDEKDGNPLSLSEIYGFMIGTCGVSKSEFMEMEPWEVDAIFNAKINERKDEWERTRFLAYITVAPHSKKGLKPRDVMEFAWDKELDKSGTPTKSDYDRIKEKFK